MMPALPPRLTAPDCSLARGIYVGLAQGSGPTLTVESDEHYESWQINADDGLLMVCTSGGNLAIWYQPANT